MRRHASSRVLSDSALENGPLTESKRSPGSVRGSFVSAKSLILWRTQHDSNVRPLPSEGYSRGLVHTEFTIYTLFRPVSSPTKCPIRDPNGVRESTEVVTNSPHPKARFWLKSPPHPGAPEVFTSLSAPANHRAYGIGCRDRGDAIRPKAHYQP